MRTSHQATLRTQVAPSASAVTTHLDPIVVYAPPRLNDSLGFVFVLLGLIVGMFSLAFIVMGFVAKGV